MVESGISYLRERCLFVIEHFRLSETLPTSTIDSKKQKRGLLEILQSSQSINWL